MLKKISFLFGFLALAGCQSTVVTQGGAEGSSTEISEVTLGNDGTFRVGVLLPLSGNAAKQGNGLKNRPFPKKPAHAMFRLLPSTPVQMFCSPEFIRSD